MTTTASDIQPIIIACALLALLLPLVSFFLCLITRDRYSWLVGLNATFLLLASFICAINVAVSVWEMEPLRLGFDWFAVGGHSVSAEFLLARPSVIMLVVVAMISFLVHLYSAGYMVDDSAVRKYFAMLGFFTFSMQGIVLADNLLVIFIFWELVSFSSYMLIGHWMERPSAAQAAKKAFIFNRAGDLGFVIGLMIIWTQTGTFSLTGMVEGTSGHPWQTAASLCIFFGVIGKSAQFPLFPWLPDAMEGPTPVSALIHAATMVAAGVYLLLRLFPLFTPEALQVFAWTGMITSLAGATAALFNFDLKRILAYSTISQLGIMVMALGMGLGDAALMHLFAHAFFKACLFLGAGAVISAVHSAQLRSHTRFDAQDIRNLGGLRKRMPATFFSFTLAAASLSGVPFFSGFLSKEAIIASLWMSSGVFSWVMLAAMLGISFITVLYSFRMTWFVFLGEPRNTLYHLVLKAPAVMRLPIILLSFSSLWFIVSWNPFDFEGWLWSTPGAYTHTIEITLFSVVWITLALIVSYYIFRKARFDRIAFFENGFYLDVIYQRTVGQLTLAASGAASFIDRKWMDGVIHAMAYAQVTIAHITSWFDKSILDGTVNGIAQIASATGAFTRSFQGGKIQVYIFWSVLAIIIFLIWILE